MLYNSVFTDSSILGVLGEWGPGMTARLDKRPHFRMWTVQIIGPHDKGISKSILANLDPRRWDTVSVLVDPLCADRTHEMVEAYFEYIASLSHYRYERVDLHPQCDEHECGTSIEVSTRRPTSNLSTRPCMASAMYSSRKASNASASIPLFP